MGCGGNLGPLRSTHGDRIRCPRDLLEATPVESKSHDRNRQGTPSNLDAGLTSVKGEEEGRREGRQGRVSDWSAFLKSIWPGPQECLSQTYP